MRDVRAVSIQFHSDTLNAVRLVWRLNMYVVRFNVSENYAYWDHEFTLAYITEEGGVRPETPPTYVIESAKKFAAEYGVSFIPGLFQASRKGLGPVELLALQGKEDP